MRLALHPVCSYAAAMGEIDKPPSGDGIEVVNLREALEERYLAYALSTIMGRALPDARDGLKPVHRRILYGMQLLRLTPDAAFKKCAKIVGDVMGSFHPHGDQAIYDALVRLAQDFATRFPLVDGQGNFGNIDGDNPAAYRYTEARMTSIASLLLEGIDEDAVDFRPNYDGQTTEPAVLPGAFPNLLANGAQGIAVGMATSIPPQNAHELCQAALHLITHPEATTAELMQFVPGPDFPTGGILIDPPVVIEECYRTGRGGFRVRARWSKEDLGRGTWVAVITEIPWLVQKGRLIEKLAELLNERKLPLVGDVRDESAEDVRIVIEPKSRNVDEGVMMESLFRLSELESRIPLNMNVLVKGQVPQVLSLGEALKQWLDHRREVLAPALAAPPRGDREAAGGSGRLHHRLSQPRRGDPHHPLRGRAEARVDGRLRAHRQPGRGDPQHAAALAAQARGDGAQARAWRTVQGEGRHREAARLRGRSSGRRSPGRSARSPRPSVPTPPLGKRRTLIDASKAGTIDIVGRDRGDGRARARHRRRFGEGLDPRLEGTHRRPLDARLQG